MINIIIVLFGATMLFISATSRIEGYIRALSVQGFCLFLCVALDYKGIHLTTLIFLLAETLVFKAVFVPLFLRNIMRDNEIYHEMEPLISYFYSLIIVSVIFIAGFYFSFFIFNAELGIKPIYFGISVSTIIAGLFFILTRNQIITHVMGFMMIENGIFLLSLSVAREMPLVVNLGLLLDVFVGLFLLGLFINKIQNFFDATNIDKLTNLKD